MAFRLILISIKKNQAGFSALEIVLALLIASLVGFTGWYWFQIKPNTDTNINKSVDQPNASKIPNVTSEQLNVKDINGSKESYAGKEIRVRGKIFVVTRQGASPCPTQEPCNTVIGVDVYISATNSTTAWNVTEPIPIYLNGKKYPCVYSSDTDIDCGRFSDGSVMTVEGRYVKTHVPDSGTGNSSGGYKVTKYKDFYYLDVGM